MERHHAVKPHSPNHRIPLAAFTLVELLVVISIIALIATIVGPVTSQVIQGNRLTSSAINLANQLNAARMLAIRLNQPVEFRFYQYVDRESPGSSPAYRACQVWLKESPYQRIVSFETGVILSMGKESSGEPWSSILNPTKNPYGANQPLPTNFKIPGATDNSGAKYSYFQFRPDGSTTLSENSQWSLTMLLEKDGAGKELPPDFVTEVIDPLTGSVRVLRPD